MENVLEKLKLSEMEAQSFREKCESTSKERTNLKDQLDQLGSELSEQVDNERKENENLHKENDILKVRILNNVYY